MGSSISNSNKTIKVVNCWEPTFAEVGIYNIIISTISPVQEKTLLHSKKAGYSKGLQCHDA